jgi:hypothetical protein
MAAEMLLRNIFSKFNSKNFIELLCQNPLHRYAVCSLDITKTKSERQEKLIS